ncbi:MAG: DUF3857 and transglutaminase domain-containing protein [Terracidiphilus sp.]
MTADPQAPGAAAVYLYREETTDDNLHFHSYYERIKVLTEKGKELATIRIPYEHGQFTVADIKGRTIHADGTIIPLTTKPSDLMDFKTKTLQVNTMVFTLPAVEVGSILEYRLELRYDDSVVSSPKWEVQQPYFVHKAHYVFSPSKEGENISNSRGDRLDKLMYAVNTGGDGKMTHNVNGAYVFDITNVPPIPTDDWMPPLNSLNWSINFYYTYTISGTDFWDFESKRWVKDTDHFANPSKALKQAVEGIVAPGDTEDQKARKIYQAVMKLDNTSFTREKSEAEIKKEKLKEIRDAEDVWTRKSGSANELALLYVALARAAGLQAYPMQVVNRDRAIFDPSYLSTYQLDDYIAIVVVGGKEIYLDPGEAMCPYGLLHWKHTVAGGIRLLPSGPTLRATPPNNYTQAAEARVADLTIDANSNVTGTLRYVMSGQDALHWRQLALKNDAEEVKKQFNEAVRADIPDGVQADFDHFLSLDDPDTNLIATVQVSGNMGAVTGKRFFLPGLFLESHARHPFVAEDKRTIPIDVHYPKEEQDDVTYRLPPGYTVESAPQAAAISWPSNATMVIKIKPRDGAVEVVRIMAYNFTLIDSKYYSDLHDFFQKVATADQQQLVLTRVPAAKGN